MTTLASLLIGLGIDKKKFDYETYHANEEILSGIIMLIIGCLTVGIAAAFAVIAALKAKKDM